MLANADMGPGEVRDFCRLDDAGKSLLKAAMQQLHMSARACGGFLKSPLYSEAGADHRRPGRQRGGDDPAHQRGDRLSEAGSWHGSVGLRLPCS